MRMSTIGIFRNHFEVLAIQLMGLAAAYYAEPSGPGSPGEPLAKMPVAMRRAHP